MSTAPHRPTASNDAKTEIKNLLNCALAARIAGISILPINHRTKKPDNDLLPRDAEGDPVWGPYQVEIADEPTVHQWFDAGAKAFAVVGGAVSGGLLVIDFDVERFYHAWREQVGELADGLPYQRTGGGGFQVFCRCPNPGGNEKLAWAPDESEDSGRTIAIETRGEGGYAVVPPSLHPSGNHYQMLSGDLTQIPTISQARADALLAAAIKLDEVPHTRQQRERLERDAAEAYARKCAATRNGAGSVIEQFNQQVPINSALEIHGYTKGKAGRYIRPGGKSESVSILDGRSCHWSSNDPLNDGKVKSGMGCHDAFDVYCYYRHGGDVGKAVKKAAEEMGMSPPKHTAYESEGCRQNPSKSTPSADKTSAGIIGEGVLLTSALKSKVSKRLRPARYKSFPTDALPYPVAQFIREAGASIGCDESFIALPLLVGMATAIGTTTRIRLKHDWTEFPIIWAVVVAASGQRKSPGFYAALRPLHDMQQKLIEHHRAEIEEYKQKALEYRQAVADRKKCGEGEPPVEPVKPTLKRVVVNDITIEALAMILEENPRGVGVARDEMSGWISSFNQYKSGKGSDASGWLELHRGGLLMVDRKTAERRTIYVSRAAASITGTIQPGVLVRGYGTESFENGMIARTLFAMPPARQREWTDRHIEPHTRDRIADIYVRLAALNFDSVGNPVDLPLSFDAQMAFVNFVNQHGEEQAKLGDDRLEAAWSKLECYAARLALIVHLVRVAIHDSDLADVNLVDEKSIASGIALVRWFGNEAKRVYADMETSDEDRQRIKLIELIRNKGGKITPRDLTRSCRYYADTDAADAALGELVGLKIGEWEHPAPGASGGRPQKFFVLYPSSADVTDTPDCSMPAEVSSTRDTQNEGFVDTPQAAEIDTSNDEEELRL